MESIRLYLRDSPKQGPRFLSVEWPKEEPLLWAEFSCSSRIAQDIDSDFVVSNTPAGHMVFFAATARRGHDEAIARLRSEGESFEVKQLGTTKSTRKSITNWLSGRDQKAWMLFGATRRAEVVREIFSDNPDWRASNVFSFLIARDGIPGWEKTVEGLVAESSRLVPQEVVRACYCVMATLWDHGMILISDKISKSEIEGVAQAIASRHKVDLQVISAS